MPGRKDLRVGPGRVGREQTRRHVVLDRADAGPAPSAAQRRDLSGFSFSDRRALHVRLRRVLNAARGARRSRLPGRTSMACTHFGSVKLVGM